MRVRYMARWHPSVCPDYSRANPGRAPPMDLRDLREATATINTMRVPLMFTHDMGDIPSILEGGGSEEAVHREYQRLAVGYIEEAYINERLEGMCRLIIDTTTDLGRQAQRGIENGSFRELSPFFIRSFNQLPTGERVLLKISLVNLALVDIADFDTCRVIGGPERVDRPPLRQHGVDEVNLNLGQPQKGIRDSFFATKQVHIPSFHSRLLARMSEQSQTTPPAPNAAPPNATPPADENQASGGQPPATQAPPPSTAQPPQQQTTQAAPPPTQAAAPPAQTQTPPQTQPQTMMQAPAQTQPPAQQPAPTNTFMPPQGFSAQGYPPQGYPHGFMPQHPAPTFIPVPYGLPQQPPPAQPAPQQQQQPPAQPDQTARMDEFFTKAMGRLDGLESQLAKMNEERAAPPPPTPAQPAAPETTHAATESDAMETSPPQQADNTTMADPDAMDTSTPDPTSSSSSSAAAAAAQANAQQSQNASQQQQPQGFQGFQQPQNGWQPGHMYGYPQGFQPGMFPPPSFNQYGYPPPNYGQYGMPPQQQQQPQAPLAASTPNQPPAPAQPAQPEKPSGITPDQLSSMPPPQTGHPASAEKPAVPTGFNKQLEATMHAQQDLTKAIQELRNKQHIEKLTREENAPLSFSELKELGMLDGVFAQAEPAPQEPNFRDVRSRFGQLSSKAVDHITPMSQSLPPNTLQPLSYADPVIGKPTREGQIMGAAFNMMARGVGGYGAPNRRAGETRLKVDTASESVPTGVFTM